MSIYYLSIVEVFRIKEFKNGIDFALGPPRWHYYTYQRTRSYWSLGGQIYRLGVLICDHIDNFCFMVVCIYVFGEKEYKNGIDFGIATKELLSHLKIFASLFDTWKFQPLRGHGSHYKASESSQSKTDPPKKTISGHPWIKIWLETLRGQEG